MVTADHKGRVLDFQISKLRFERHLDVLPRFLDPLSFGVTSLRLSIRNSIWLAARCAKNSSTRGSSAIGPESKLADLGSRYYIAQDLRIEGEIHTEREQNEDQHRTGQKTFDDRSWIRVRINPFTPAQQDQYFGKADHQGKVIGGH